MTGRSMCFKSWLTFVLFLGVALQGYSQDDFDDFEEVDEDAPRFFMGVNVGGYFANRNTAKFYSGTGAYNGGYSIEWIWNGQNPNGTTNLNYDRIFQALGDRDFELGETPDSMRYNGSLVYGVNMGYMFNKRSGLFLDVNIANLELVDVFTLFVNDPNNFFEEPVIVQGTITGVEKRLSVNLGYRQLFGNHERAFPYLEMGVNINSTRPESNEVFIEDLRFSILPPQNNGFNAPVRYGGSGVGAILGGGLHYKFNEKFRFDLGLNFKYERIKLIVDEEPLRLQQTLFARILFL